MFCKKCGQQLNEGAKFCGNCGTPIGVQNQRIVADSNGYAGMAERPAAPETIAAEQKGEKKSGKKVLAILLISLCLLLAAGAAGWFIIQRMNEDERDKAMSEEEDEWEKEAPEREGEKGAVSWLPWSRSGSADSEAASESVEESAAEESDVEEAPKAEDAEAAYYAEDETGIHTYELIVDDVTWTEAYEDCLDRGGHLVRINSEEEYLAILEQISEENKDKIMFWLGGTRSFANQYEYRWIYGDGTYGKEVLNEEEPYIWYWLDGEPSFYDESVDQDEWCMNMFYVSKEGRWVWNDVPDDLIAIAEFYAGRIGYICEYED